MRRLLAVLRSSPPDLVAGGPAVLFALVVYGLAAPPAVAVLGAVVIFAAVRLALTSGVLDALDRPAFEPAEHKAESDDLTREVLTEARGEMQRLLAASMAVREPVVRAHLVNFYTLGSTVIGEVERQPRRLGSVRRLLTYYLPSATRLGTGYQVLETARSPDGARLAATRTMIQRLYETCARQADRLNETDVDGLDVELKLLDDALDEEERSRPAALAPPGILLPDPVPREAAPLATRSAEDGTEQRTAKPR